MFDPALNFIKKGPLLQARRRRFPTCERGVKRARDILRLLIVRFGKMMLV
jgi:hypothetical protein